MDKIIKVKTTLRGGKTKRVATGKHEAVVRIPDIVGLVIVAVEPQIGIVPLHIEQLEVAIRIGNA